MRSSATSSWTAYPGTGLTHGRTLDADFGALAYGGDLWRLRAEDAARGLAQRPSVFTLGDGFIGERGPGDPVGAPRVYLNVVFEQTPID